MKILIGEFFFLHPALRKNQINYKIKIYLKPSEKERTFNLFHLWENIDKNKSIIKIHEKETIEILTNSS